MKLHTAFASLIPVFSLASGLEAARLRKLSNGLSQEEPLDNGSPSTNIFAQEKEPAYLKVKGRDGQPGLEGSETSEFMVENVSFDGIPSKEELHGQGQGQGQGQGGGPPDNIPAQGDMTALTDGVTVGEMGGAPSRHGKVEVSNLGPDFSKVPVLVFKGLDDKNNANKPLVLRRVGVNVPLPKVWKMVEGSGDLVGEDAQVWYGEEVGKQATASAMFMVNGEGSIVGSIQDGVNTYSIQTEYEEDDSPGRGNWRSRTKYSVVKMSDLPSEEDSDEIDDGKRLLRSNLRKVGIDATALIENSRNLQEDCDDIEGYYGSWYDSDGPFYDCQWYSQSSYCSAYGNDYSNFGFTANQACCACGGGGILIDILVVYSFQTIFQANMLNLINLCIYQTNLALSMSGTNARLRLVGTSMVDIGYSDFGKSNKAVIDELRQKDDGQLDYVHAWRDTYGADLVHYIGENVPSGRAAAIGGNEAYGFAVSKRELAALAGQHTFAHEIGHNLGCRHDIRNDDTPGYNHGFFDQATCSRTLMTYPNGCSKGRILQFSNTMNTFNGVPVGDASTSNNGRTITERAQTLKGFRAAKISRTVELCKHYGCEGGSYRASHMIGDWTSMPADINNDQLSQVYIPQGLSFEYFEHGSFGGWHRSYGSPTNDVLLNMGGHNDAVSSFKVRQIPSGRVKLCRHSDCSGGYVYYASVGTWTSMPSVIGNDALSFVNIPRGFKFEYFQNTGLGGWNRSFGSKDNGINLSMGGHNDAVSSFIISVL